MKSQIILQHLGIDTYLMMIKLQLRVEACGHAEEYMRFMGFTQEKKPTSVEISEWVEAMKLGCLQHFEAAYLPEEKPTSRNVAETKTADNGATVTTVTTVSEPAITGVVVEAEPKKATKGKKKATETVETSATPAPAVAAKVAEPAIKSEPVNNQPAKVELPSSQKAEEDLLAEEAHDDIMFNRADKVHLQPIMAKLTELDKNWKSNTELIAKLKAVLDLANGKWIFCRDGKLNKGLFIEVIFAAKHDKNLPEPRYEAQ